MRKRYRVLLLAAIAAAVGVPVGFALSLEAQPAIHAAAPMVVATSSPAPALIRTWHASTTASVPEGAKLFAVGTVLFGAAAAVRRAV